MSSVGDLQRRIDRRRKARKRRYLVLQLDRMQGVLDRVVVIQEAVMERYLIPAGTTIHVAGFPVEIEEAVTVRATPGNWQLIRAEMKFPPQSSEPLPETEK